jgi:opacity protein-like surface antigen
VKKRLLVAVFAVVLFGSCSSADVDWENYAPEVRTRIDRMATEGDCDGLQAEFDTADANDAAQRDRVGSGNADLMGYIDGKLSEAGCYG